MRTPRGTYVRPTPDRFLGVSAMAAGLYYSSNNTAAAIGLFNNASDGSSLHVFAAWAFPDGTGPLIWSRQHGATGTSAGPGAVVTTQRGAPPGLIYYEDRAGISATNLPQATFTAGYMVTGDVTGGLNALTDGGPLCVLLPGDALYCQQRWVGATPTVLGVTFHYTVLKDTGEG